jgi:signal transduction histidine kinase
MVNTEADIEPVRLDQHLDSVINNARSEFDDAIITVENPIPNTIVSGNDLLKAVFRNLLKNAVVHNDKETPQIQLSVMVNDETLTVSVADNGPGISDGHKEEIFGKGDKGLDSPGTGIGLYLVQTLVNQYGGNVYVEDNSPEGAVFMVELPMIDAEQE